MHPLVVHPPELTELDLFDVWRDAQPLSDSFDPFSFEHRMAAYRLLIDAINEGDRFGQDNRRNPLWGLMFQHQWQLRTGRLGAGSSESRRIDPDAPWGYGNYVLSVVPWLGAVSAGLVPDLDLIGPSSESRFEYASGVGVKRRVPRELRTGIADWASFFHHVMTTDLVDDPEPTRMALWKAHKTCLDVVTERLVGIDPSPYSTVELSFLRGWCRMVDYLWVAAWPTDFDFMSTHGLDVLPERLLVDDDRFSDLPHNVRSNVRNVINLGKTPGWRYDLNLTLWKRIMRTRGARRDVLALLDAIFNPARANVGDQLRALGYLARPW
ncbi:MAG TPA: Leg1-related protein [Nocardioidaceae bacterium]|nr:Leg1-related protein [Nocardioidaceae bacterium]